MSNGKDRALAVMKGYKPERAAPLVLWGLLLAVAAPLVGLFAPTVAAPLLGGAVGLASAVLLITGCYTAARNTDYTAAVTYYRVVAENEARREAQELLE